MMVRRSTRVALFLLGLGLVVVFLSLLVRAAPVAYALPQLHAAQPVRSTLSSATPTVTATTTPSLSVTATPTPSPTATPVSPVVSSYVVTPDGKHLYGFKGPNGTCQSRVYYPLDYMLEWEFHASLSQSPLVPVINAPYTNDSLDYLCTDYWAWSGTGLNPQQTPPTMRQILQTLHWELNPPIIDPGSLDMQVPVGDQKLPPLPGKGPVPPPVEPAACNVPLPFNQTWNICDPLRAGINGIANAIGQAYLDPDNNGDNDQTQGISAAQAHAQDPDGDGGALAGLIWQTPQAPFQNDAVAHLLTAWTAVWSIVLLCIMAVIAWGALRLMIGAVVSWLSYAQILELLPRLLFALIAALLSKQFFWLLIDANNALSSHFSNTLVQTILGHKDPGIKLGLIQIIFGIMGFLLLIEEIIRFALLYVLFAASPLLFFFAALPETQHWAQAAAKAIIVLVFMQAVQAFILYVGDNLFASVLGGGDNSTFVFLNLLVAIGILYVTLAVFFGLLRMAFNGGFTGSTLRALPFLALAGFQFAMAGGRQAFDALNSGKPGGSQVRPSGGRRSQGTSRGSSSLRYRWRPGKNQTSNASQKRPPASSRWSGTAPTTPTVKPPAPAPGTGKAPTTPTVKPPPASPGIGKAGGGTPPPATTPPPTPPPPKRVVGRRAPMRPPSSSPPGGGSPPRGPLPSP